MFTQYSKCGSRRDQLYDRSNLNNAVRRELRADTPLFFTETSLAGDHEAALGIEVVDPDPFLLMSEHDRSAFI